MRNYIHTLLNLPGILARIERELQGKASSAAVTALNARLVNRPTTGDLTILRSDLESRVEKLEATLLPAEKTGEANLGELPAFNGNHATESNVFATLSATIDPTETVGFVDDLRDQVMNGKITPNQAREALGKAPMPKVEGKVTKALKKPRAPKGGGQ